MRFFFFLFFMATSAVASEQLNHLISIKDHKFEPNKIQVPANTAFTLTIKNLDKTLEEFESDDLKKEKLVGAGKTITINVGPQKQGDYKFYGDFHQKTAQGIIEVR